MKLVSFEELYHTDFFISEAFAKYQNWYSRDNVYSSLSRPKPSHTLLWFKNCSGRITQKDGSTADIRQNGLLYTAKGSEYVVRFFGTAPNRVDTAVVHFQMTDRFGNDIAPSLASEVCLNAVDMSSAVAIEELCEEFEKNIVCVPETNAVIYSLLARVCRSKRNEPADFRYACIRPGIELLESGAELSCARLAAACGVSECYFRRLFKEYSGHSPVEFRQRQRIERAKKLLLSDMYTVGEIASELHFSDVYHFSKTFKNLTGLSPTAYLAKCRETASYD